MPRSVGQCTREYEVRVSDILVHIIEVGERLEEVVVSHRFIAFVGLVGKKEEHHDEGTHVDKGYYGNMKKR